MERTILGGGVHRGGIRIFNTAHQPPKSRRSARVDDQMHAAFAAVVDNPVAQPRIEQPALARAHVQTLRPAVEDHVRLGGHRNVNAHATEPVVVEVHVQAHLATGVQRHEPRPRDHLAQAGHQLPGVRTTRQVRRGAFLAIEGIVVAAAAGNERDSGIAAHSARVRHPSAGRELRGLFGQARRIEPQRQADEGLA